MSIRSSKVPARPRSKNYPVGSVVKTLGGGGYSSAGGSVVDIIKELDTRILSDSNVFSSLRTLLEIRSSIDESNKDVLAKINDAISSALKYVEDNYLSSKSPDTAQGLITFLAGLTSEELATLKKGLKVTGTTETDILKVLTSATIEGKIISVEGHTHTFASLIDKPTTLSGYGITDAVTSSSFNSHTSNTTVHITSAERTNWNGVVSNWDKAFYFDASDNLKVKLNLIGEKEVSAYGAGSGSGGGAITIVDALTSTSKDAALSANMGRELKSLIDGKISSVAWEDITSKPTTFTPSSHTHSNSDLTGLQGSLDAKVDKVSGKQLSTNDYTTAEKTKLSGIATNANNYSLPTASTTLGGVKTTSTVTSTSGYTPTPIIGGVPYYKDTNTTYGVVTTTANGLMIAADKVKLDGIETNANNYVLPAASATVLGGVKYGSTSGTACQGNDARLSNARPASDVYSWAKASVKPSYNYSEIGGTVPTWNQSTTGNAATATNASQLGGVAANQFLKIDGNYTSSAFNDIVPMTVKSLSEGNSSKFDGDLANKTFEGNVLTIGTPGSAGHLSFQLAVPTSTNHGLYYASYYISTNHSRRTFTRVYDSKNANLSTVDWNAAKITTPYGISTNWADTYDTNRPWYGCTFKDGVTHLSGWAGINLKTNLGLVSILPNGTVGIGTSTQTEKLEVVGNVKATKFIGALDGNAATATNATQLGGIVAANYWHKGNSNRFDVDWLCKGLDVRGYAQFDDEIYGFNDWYTEGSIGCDGDVNCFNLIATGELTAFSDRRLKSDIKPLTNRGYIEPVTYVKDGKKSIGFIAQDVREIYPELVQGDEDKEMLSVNYQQYTAVLQAQIIELNTHIDVLNEQNKKLNERLEALERRIK